MSPSPHSAPEALAEAQERFIDTWGKMGAVWGISRTMAEVHALLYICAEPLNTDDVMQRLQISRGNASMSIRALVDWGVVARTHKRGDRKEYFVAESDVWTMFRIIVRERMKREVEPVLAALYDIREMTAPGRVGKTAADDVKNVSDHNERLDEMVQAIETIDKLSERFASPSGKGLRFAATALAKLSG